MSDPADESEPARVRRSGVLLHPTCLPGPWSSGDLGAPARAFVDFLADAGQVLWQVLPLGIADLVRSPYRSPSSAAGDPLLVGPDDLVEAGLLDRADPPRPNDGTGPAGRADLERERLPLLRRSHESFQPEGELGAAWQGFLEREHEWLDDHCLFLALRDAHQGAPWTEWEPGLARREPAELERARRELEGEIAFQRHAQFLFDLQWRRLRAHARERGVRIVGDLSMNVALDGADVWLQRELFEVDPLTGSPRAVAGVPPDAFSETGQLWDMPIYDWAAMAADGFGWWLQRFARLARLVDAIRIDHFRGLEAFWRIPAEAETAVEGEWVSAPGDELLATLRAKLGDVELWAEDLGHITPAVDRLRRTWQLPGMRVLQFAFDESGGTNRNLPFRHPRECVVYTGTHDNDTSLGWWRSLEEDDRTRVRRVLGEVDEASLPWAMVRLALSSCADDAVIPLQDLLGLGSEARMNHPGQQGGNWTWRFADGALGGPLAERLGLETETFGRARQAP